MNSGIYAALSGSIAALKRMDTISNNLANVNTPGFKKDKMAFESMLAGVVKPPAVPSASTADPILQKENVFVDYGSGSVSQTGNPFDLAIDGDGFFTIQTPQGQAYTRQGNFRLSADGTLVTSDGNAVLGQNGPLRIQGGLVEISNKGEVLVDGVSVGTLSIVDFAKPYNLTKLSSAQFVPSDARITPQPSTASVNQGQLEGSNVETITEMVQMIETNRYYETCQRVIKGFDDMAGKAANDLGKL